MRKVLILLLALTLCLSLCACSKKSYFEESPKIPMPSELEISNTDKISESLVMHAFLLKEGTTAEEANQALENYLASIEEEGIAIKNVGEIGYSMTLGDQEMGYVNVMSSSDGYSILVALMIPDDNN